MSRPAEEYNLLKGRFGYLWLGVFFASQVFLFFISDQKDFISILIPYVLAFGSYMLLIRKPLNSGSIYFLIKIGLLLRVFCLFTFPHLSDDVYRYWWDGTLLFHGINPFSYTPAEILNTSLDPALKKSLYIVFPNLNSPDYHTVYPGYSQLLFYLGVLMSGKNLFLFSLVLKLFFFIGDLLLLYVSNNLTRKLNLPLGLVLVYFLNPLIITELSGNLHFELWLVIFLAWAILYILENKYVHSGIMLSLSILSKIITAFLAPLFLSFKSIKHILIFIFIVVVLCIAAQFYFIHDISHLKGYLLYLRQFEFNSLIYGTLEQYFIQHNLWVLKSKTGMITGGIFMGLYTLIIGFYFVKQFKTSGSFSGVVPNSNSLMDEKFNFKLAWWILFLYLLLSSTVHPWYLATLLFLGIFSYPLISIVWTGLIMLSYIHYDKSYDGYFNLVKILEYSVLCVVLCYTIAYPNKKFLNIKTVF
ncbi:MAG: hypothetical protein JNK69_08760 [Saprospiraceae bacterium]|nr:hypothetical protein [Candidatus Vicinibacter proximus]MBL7823486.1 hypothetical protein [Saprospiraceae bacterium]HRG33449.1 hypothetical protein [Saprospiraceae bacterium]